MQAFFEFIMGKSKAPLLARKYRARNGAPADLAGLLQTPRRYSRDKNECTSNLVFAPEVRMVTYARCRPLSSNRNYVFPGRMDHCRTNGSQARILGRTNGSAQRSNFVETSLSWLRRVRLLNGNTGACFLLPERCSAP